MNFTFRLLLILATLGFVVRAHAEKKTTRDPAFESRVVEQLRKQAPDAVPTFEQATAAMDGEDYATAANLFAEVLKAAPRFVHAKRRECTALAADGKRAAALPFCRAAIAEEDSPENEAALARVLVGAKGMPASTSDAKEAKRLAQKASTAKPDDVYAWVTLFEAGVALGDLEAMRQGTENLERLLPEDPGPHLYRAFVEAGDGHHDRAIAALDRARARGLPEDKYTAMAQSIDAMNAQPWWIRAASLLGRAVVLWLAILALLLGAGYALSRITLRAIELGPTEAHARPSELRLRRVYRALLIAAGAFYYASLPLLAVIVIAGVVGIIGAILASGWIVPKLFIILGIVGLSSLVAIARSVFVRPSNEDPGTPLDLAENPALRDTLHDVAKRIGTRPIDRVFVTPFTSVAVLDRGGFLAQLRGTRQRCLVLGAGVLEGMRVVALKSVLAHEYGHFRNEDTAGGGFALSVRRSLLTMTLQLAARGAASPLNPAWWFVRGYARAFLGISQGASRLQEVLADRWATFAYGSSAFEEGLRHVITRDVRFGAHVEATVEEVVKHNRALPNLYAFVPAAPKRETALEEEVAKVFERAPSPYDSHPCPADRVRWVRALAAENAPSSANDDAEAWSLFADRAALEARMTAEVRVQVQRAHGVVVLPK